MLKTRATAILNFGVLENVPLAAARMQVTSAGSDSSIMIQIVRHYDEIARLVASFECVLLVVSSDMLGE